LNAENNQNNRNAEEKKEEELAQISLGDIPQIFQGTTEL
jgi:hypothetical protein